MTDAPEPSLAAISPTELDEFRAERQRVAASAFGPLALINTQAIDSPQPVYGVPGRWAPLPAGESGLLVIAGASDDIHVDGRPVDGEAVARGRDDERPSEITFSPTLHGFVVATPTGYALRVWDAESDGVRAFGSVESFPHNPAAVARGRFVADPDASTIAYEQLHENGITREPVVAGEIRVEIAGVERTIQAFDAGGAVHFVFSDATSGVDTYSVGRLLTVTPDDDGSVLVDFNRAVLPPCAFSYNFACPLTPVSNRLSERIEAGEKNVLTSDGALLHG